MMLPAGRPALTCATMRSRRRLAGEERALEVDAQHAVEIGLLQVEEVGGVDDAGVVDQDVERAERRDGVVDQLLDRARIADVGGDEAGVGAERLGLGLPGRRVDIRDDDARALRDVALGDGEPDAARAAGDDRNLVRKPHELLRAVCRC